MEKKDDADRHLAEIVEDLIADVGDDRQRLTSFLDGLIKSFSGDQAVGIAEYVAKLMDAATRQHQVKAALVKTLARRAPADGDSENDEIANEIGLPFKEELEDGSN